MKSSVNKIFYGIILSSTALSINTFPLFNDFIGILIIMSGLKELMQDKDEEGYFNKGYKYCGILLVITVIGYGLDIWGKDLFIKRSALVTSVSVVLTMLSYYYIIKGFKKNAKENQDIVEKYEHMWKYIFTVMAALLIYLPFTMNIEGTDIENVATIVIVVFYTLSKISLAVVIRKNEFGMMTKELGNEK